MKQRCFDDSNVYTIFAYAGEDRGRSVVIILLIRRINCVNDDHCKIATNLAKKADDENFWARKLDNSVTRVQVR